MSDAETKTDDQVKEGVTLKEVAPAVHLTLPSKRSWRSVMLPLDPEQSAEAVEDRHVAMSVFRFYWLRLNDFVIDIVVACMLGGITAWIIGWLRVFQLLHTIDSVESFFYSNSFRLAVISIFLIWIKYVRGLHDYANVGLRVVDRDGRRLTKTRSILRSIAFCLTWFLFPMHLVFMAVGSRRLLHDFATGTYVIGAKENLKTTIYPPASRWLAPLLVMSCVGAVFSSANFVDHLLRWEHEIVSSALSRSDPGYLAYLKIRLCPSVDKVEKLAPDEAKRLLPFYLDLAQGQKNQYAEHLSRGGDISNSLRDAALCAEYFYDVATLYAKCGMPRRAHGSIYEMACYPKSAIDLALGSRVADMQTFYDSPAAVGSIYIMRFGYFREALAEARLGQHNCLVSYDKKGYLASSQVVVLCLKLMRDRADSCAEPAFDAEIELEEAKMAKLLAQTGI